MMLVWSHHWWFGYPFVMLPMREWVHYNRWYASKYHCNYRIRKWNSHTKKGFSPFPPPYTNMNGYCHHHKWFLNLGKCYHYRSNSYKLGTTYFDNDNTCNNRYRSKQGIILHKVKAKKWFHSPCHNDLRLSPSSFWFFFDFLCTCQYSLPLAHLLGTFNAYILL
jgi:hypothetical protein